MIKLPVVKQAVLELTDAFQTFDPFCLCEARGITLRKAPLPDTVRGLYVPVIDTRYVLIHSEIAPPWQRFVCAHELGHDVLHGDLLTGAHVDTRNTLLGNERLEFEANAFAAFLLMLEQGLKGPFPFDAVVSASKTRESKVLAHILRDRSAEYC